MGKYVSVASNKESVIRGGLDEALSECVADMKNASLIKESFISPIKGVFEKALKKFNEDVEYDSPHIVETFNDIGYRVELFYISEPIFKLKHYYIRFEWLY